MKLLLTAALTGAAALSLAGCQTDSPYNSNNYRESVYYDSYGHIHRAYIPLREPLEGPSTTQALGN